MANHKSTILPIKKRPLYPIKPYEWLVCKFFLKWAMDTGYTQIISEYEMPNRPPFAAHWHAVDFYCEHADGHFLLAECKATLGANLYEPRKSTEALLKKLVDACDQTQKYYNMCMHLWDKNTRLMLVYPAGELFPHEIEYIKGRGIEVFELPMPDRYVSTLFVDNAWVERVQYDRNQAQ